MSVADSGILLAGPRRRPGLPAIRLVEAFAYALLAAFIFFICFTFLRPSPYDFFAIPAMALWFCLGIRLHRSSVTFVALLLAYHLGLLISLLPYFDEPGTVEWTYQSVYLILTAIFFAMLFSDNTAKRIEFVLKAYLASCLFAAAAGIASCAVTLAGALTVGDIAERFEDRAQLTKDYDEGVTGRFGNQLRSLPMLIERPNGFGPLRFRLFFGLEPHNSYIGGFANGGWIGGFSFIFLVLATGYLGSR